MAGNSTSNNNNNNRKQSQQRNNNKKKNRTLSPKSILDYVELEKFLEENDSLKSHRQLIWKQLLPFTTITENNKTPKTFHDIKGIPKHIQSKLSEEYTTGLTSKVVDEQKNSTGGKLVIQLQQSSSPQDDEPPLLIESVIIKNDRYTTICVSSQVGCKMGCTFCETGTMGLSTNLKSSEIIEQIIHAKNLGYDIRNVVFMGMGEPLDNYNNVLQAIHGLNKIPGIYMPYYRITVSTVGVIPYIRKLAVDCPKVQLALSLHAPNTTIRNLIVPSTRSYPVNKIIDAIDYYIEQCSSSGKKQAKFAGVMIEYIMIHNVNSSPKEAHELGLLLQGRKNIQVNLIPYNPTDAGNRFNYECPSDEDIQKFQKIVSSYNTSNDFIRTHIRWSTREGQDINASCGQLALKNIKLVSQQNQQKENQNQQDIIIPPDIEDISTSTSGYDRGRQRHISGSSSNDERHLKKRNKNIDKGNNDNDDNVDRYFKDVTNNTTIMLAVCGTVAAALFLGGIVIARNSVNTTSSRQR